MNTVSSPGQAVQTSPLRREALSLLSLISLAFLAVTHFFKFKLWNFDDSYIVFRIVRNIIEGNGWRYNIGELHNASTSVLNTIVISLIALITRDVPLAAHIVGAVSILISSVLVFLLLKEQGLLAAVVGSFLLSISLASNSTWGLETHLFVALSTLFLFLEWRGRGSWWVIGLLILARPDALVLALLKGISQLLEEKRVDIRGVAICGAIIIPWALYSLFTFHQIFPATLSNKVWQGRSGFWGHGWIYLRGLGGHLISSGPLFLVATVLAVFELLFTLAKRRSTPLLIFSLFVLAQQSAYILLNVPPYHWYFSLFDVFVILLFASFLGRVTGNVKLSIQKRTQLIFPLIGGLFFMSAAQLLNALGSESYRDARDEGYKKAAIALEKLGGVPEGSIAALEVGTIGFNTSRPIVDLVGLTSANPEFISGTHNDLFFSLLPAVVLIHSPVWHQERALFDDVRFSLAYEKKMETDDPNFALQIFVRKDEGDLKGLLSDKAGIARLIAKEYVAFRPAEEGTFTEVPFPKTQCIVDRVNAINSGNILTLAYPLLRIRGWVADIEGRTRDAETLFVLLQGEQVKYTATAARHQRQDVAIHLNSVDFLNAGFSAEASTTDVAPGDYTMGVAERRASGEFVVCPLPGILRLG